jgi:hypothetical protein
MRGCSLYSRLSDLLLAILAIIAVCVLYILNQTALDHCILCIYIQNGCAGKLWSSNLRHTAIVTREGQLLDLAL